MTNYDNFAKIFARSRKSMKWPEIEYCLGFIGENTLPKEAILDVGCGSGRLLETLQGIGITSQDYLGIDLSQGLLDEAQKSFPDYVFQKLDMRGISLLKQDFSLVFLVASFHHLETYIQRQQVLKQVYNITQEGGYVFLINWYLIGGANSEKYNSSIIPGSENEFGSVDYNILFGSADRFYHGFSLSELDVLCQEAGFSIAENRIFDGERNILTILKK